MLPLAEEYQLDHLKSTCHKVLLQYTYPRLEFVTLAEKYGLTELLDKAIDDCAAKICHNSRYYGAYRSLERQVQDSVNEGISYESLYKIYRYVFSITNYSFIGCNCE